MKAWNRFGFYRNREIVCYKSIKRQNQCKTWDYNAPFRYTISANTLMQHTHTYKVNIKRLNEPCSVERREKKQVKGICLVFIYFNFYFVCLLLFCFFAHVFLYGYIKIKIFTFHKQQKKKQLYKLIAISIRIWDNFSSLIRFENIFISRFFFPFYYFLNEMPFKWYDLVKMRIAFILLSIDYHYYFRCFSLFSNFYCNVFGYNRFYLAF